MNESKRHIVEFVNIPHGMLIDPIKTFTMEVLDKVCSKPVEITVAFMDDDQMRTLNKQFRGKDSATDVLSFPMIEDKSQGIEHLGDIAISIPTAECQARELDHSLTMEILNLIAHGILHLCGYDHETDSGEMENLEKVIRKDTTPRYCR